MREIVDLLKEEKQLITSKLKEIKKLLHNAPEGKLRCETKKYSYQYYMKDGTESNHKNGTYIKKEDEAIAQKLANKEYALKMQKQLTELLKRISYLLEIYENNRLEESYTSLCEARRRLITPIIQPENEFIQQWLSEEYKSKGFNDDDETEHYTMQGERVRSKSEKMIADEFLRYGIPYKYERPLILQSWNREVKIYPDFTVLSRRTRKEMFVEHLGMMGDIDYVSKTMKKLDMYEKNGILLGKQLLLFHETQDMPLNIRIVDQYIQQYLL